MANYRAEYGNGATRDFTASNRKQAIERAYEIADEEQMASPYVVFLLDEDGNEIKRL